MCPCIASDRRKHEEIICEQNVAHFRRLLEDATDPIQRKTLERLLASELRQLAMLDAAGVGAAAVPSARRERPVDALKVRPANLADFYQSPHLYLLLDPGPGLQIVDVNASYASATFTDRNEILGRSLFGRQPTLPRRPATANKLSCVH